MQQNDGERAIEQQDDLPSELRRFRLDSGRLERNLQPGLDPLLVFNPDFHGWMARHIGEFRRGAQEAAALPFRMAGRAGEIAKDALHLIRRLARRFRVPALEQREVRLVARLQIGPDEIVLLAKW